MKFLRDPYFQENNPMSVLCIPLNKNTSDILYLENYLASHLFSVEMVVSNREGKKKGEQRREGEGEGHSLENYLASHLFSVEMAVPGRERRREKSGREEEKEGAKFFFRIS
jgi:hypothetical protein